MDKAINLAHAFVSETANGPGRRFTVWTQGCPLSCPGCFNPELQPLVPRRMVSPAELAREAANSRPWEGVTLSGGEPFLQAAGLTAFLDELQELVPPFATIAFTGHRVEDLRTQAAAAGLLGRVDLVVDGPYRTELTAQLPLRASSNQRLVALTPAGRALRERVDSEPPVGCEVLIGGGGEVILTGFPPPDLIRGIRGSAMGAR